MVQNVQLLPHMGFLHMVEEVKESTTKTNSETKALGFFSVNTHVALISAENTPFSKCVKW